MHVHLPTPEWLDQSMAGYVEAAEAYFRSPVQRLSLAELAEMYRELETMAVLLAFLKSLERHGFCRILIVNGHGGNIAALNAFLPDFARETGVRVLAATYFELAASDIAPLLEDQTGVQHACEVETSLMMVLAPDTVKHDRIGEAFGRRGNGPAGAFRTIPMRFRSFKDVTDSGVNGDARRASRQKGQKLLAVCTEGLANVLANEKLWAETGA